MKIFVSAPLTQMLDPKTRLIRQDYANWLGGLIDFLKRKGHEVSSAHIREEWGRKLLPPEECAPKDFKLIQECDIFVAVLKDSISLGVFLEIGAAAAWGKKILLLKESTAKMPYLLSGFHKITDTSVLDFDNWAELVEKLEKFL